MTSSPAIVDLPTARIPRILLCCSGSVATVKVPELVMLLSELGDVRVLCSSNAAEHFLDRAEEYNPATWKGFCQLGGKQLIIRDSMEWNMWDKIGDPVIHIELRRWADIIVVAPASADLLAKASHGFADSLLLCTLRAWDFTTKPCLYCPAMNTFMWSHPTTSEAVRTLVGWGCQFVLPVVKELACKDVGNGALAPVKQIVEAVAGNLENIELAPDTPEDLERIRLFDHIFAGTLENKVNVDKNEHATNLAVSSNLVTFNYFMISIICFLLGYVICVLIGHQQ